MDIIQEHLEKVEIKVKRNIKSKNNKEIRILN